MHVNLEYSATGSTKDNCTYDVANLANISPIGRIGCDPSLKLIDYMLKRFKDKFGEVDVLLAPGDTVGHGLAPHRVKKKN